MVGIAASGRTPYVLGALKASSGRGALTVGLSCVPGSPVEQACALPVTLSTGAEVVTGSTRLKAGTATKLVLNMISTATMAQLGYVYGNLMVNVQPTNAKLRDRAARIVAELTGLAPEDAMVALDRAAGEVKTAVVMARGGLLVEEARQQVSAAGGSLRRALDGNGGLRVVPDHHHSHGEQHVLLRLRSTPCHDDEHGIGNGDGDLGNDDR